MIVVKRNDLEKNYLPGRIIQKAVGKDGYSESKKITTGFGHYSAESGPMEPHHHAEEVVYIVDAHKGWAAWGESPDKLDNRVALESGMSLHFSELEWHVFEYEEGGFVDIMFIYGQTENIRPEEIEASKEK